MRFLVPLVALCALSTAPLRASDIFNITLSAGLSGLSGSGTFTTDGICSVCRPGLGLLSLTINIGLDNSGLNAFDISDDNLFNVSYERGPNFLFYDAHNSETGDILNMIDNLWDLTRAGSMIGAGTFSVTPVPEPHSLFLLMPIVAIVGLRWRHQRASKTPGNRRPCTPLLFAVSSTQHARALLFGARS
jgi:hypothetical protein